MDAFITFWVDCGKWYVTGADEDGFICYDGDGSKAAIIDYRDISRVINSIVNNFEPEKVTLEFLAL